MVIKYRQRNMLGCNKVEVIRGLKEVTVRSFIVCTTTECCSGDQITMNDVGGSSGTYRVEERCIQGLVGTPEGKRPLERPRHRWEDNIRMGLKEICGKVMD
jgi:hypothetical protein